MKKVLILVLIIGVGVSAWFVFNNNSSEELENKIKIASEDYFVKYVSANDSQTEYKVTLEELENQNEYDLKGLEKCDKKETKAIITPNYKNGKVKKTQIKLKC